MNEPLKPLKNHRFIADVHLARLARDLRMLGLDTLWSSDAATSEDQALLEAALSERRVLLTRDRSLHERTPEEHRYYVQSTEPGAQIREVLSHFQLWEQIRSHRGFLTRCLECNTMILPIGAKMVAERVPAHIILTHTEFFLCPRCERVYWKGSHWERMKKWVESLENAN